MKTTKIMKIAMMSTWNIPCGGSVHAQLVGTAWRDAGHKLTVFAPQGIPTLTSQDDPWVKRYYTVEKKRVFNSRQILDKDYDLFLLQHISPMPIKKLLCIATQIKKKAKTVVIIHEGMTPEKELAEFPWDAVICFDHRYKSLLKRTWNEDKIHIIPYPCHPVKQGNKLEARKELNLPQDKMIVMVYGISVHHYLHILPTLERVNKKKPLEFIMFTSVHDWYDLFHALSSKYSFVKPYMATISNKELYTYLHASDAMIYHRDSSVNVVVASTIFATMGSGCPILALDSNFVDTLKKEIVKYHRQDELEKILLKDQGEWKQTSAAALKYAEKNSSIKIAKRLIRLFKKL